MTTTTTTATSTRAPRTAKRSLRRGTATARILALALLSAPAFAWTTAAQDFGGSLAVSGGHVLVGEARNVSLPGVVYVYGPSSDGWRETGRLAVSSIPGPPDGFGRSLSADGDWVLAGAPKHGDGGAAILFRASGDGQWQEFARLDPGTLEAGADFGAAVALSGRAALVSAPGESDGLGAVYLFATEADGAGEWTLRARFQLPAEPSADDGPRGFGTAVALGGATALAATAGGRDAVSQVHALHADVDAGVLAPEGRLDAPEPLEPSSRYGAGLAVRDGVAVVGAPGVAAGEGAVFVFRPTADSGARAWASAGRLVGFDGGSRASFGSAVGFDGAGLWVGAPGGDGALYRFAPSSEGANEGVAGWAAVAKAARPSLPERAGFGSTLAVAGDVAVAGAGGIDSRAGGAVLMARGDDGSWGAGELVIGEHRGLPAIAGLERDIPCAENDAAGYECDNVDIISFLPIKEMAGGRGARLNDVWGWTDPETNREIAIVGRTDGTAFVDVTDPYNPAMLGNLPKTPGSRSSVWRDMKVYRDHAYVVADGAGEHGVQVFDLRRLRAEGGPDAVFEPDYTYPGIHSAHNIVVNEQTGFAYAVGSSGGGETCGGGLHMLSLDDPSRPAFAGCFFDESTGRRRTGYSHDAQCVIYHGPDEEHQGKEICLGSNETALSIADVTDKNAPVALAAVDYPSAIYAHQGWLTEDHRYFYMNDEGDEPQGLVEGTRTLVWDVEDLDEPVLATEYIAETPDTDHNLYIVGDLMYQSNYGAGLRILDISDPVDPVEIAYFDTTPYEGGASWSNYPYFESGIVVVTSTGDGLFLVRNTARRNLIP